MTILDEIINQKKEEVAKAKQNVSIEELKLYPYFSRKTLSLKEVLSGNASSGIIAEFKRKSPSKGIIHANADVAKITKGYADNGAAGISVLTDNHFFGGCKEDLIQARKVNSNTPLLRKDFMIDPYQLYEAKAWGADVILLIAANLSTEEIFSLSATAKQLNLEVLLEVHDLEEIEKSVFTHIDIIGVNNRNLKNFSESTIQASLDLYSSLPNSCVKISESCISQAETVNELKKVGYQGFLMGENFMKTPEPALSLLDFINQVG